MFGLRCTIRKWWGWRDSNSHTLRRQNLNLVRLPIPPQPHFRYSIIKSSQIQMLSRQLTDSVVRLSGWLLYRVLIVWQPLFAIIFNYLSFIFDINFK